MPRLSITATQFLVVATGTLFSAAAQAHFNLMAPPSWMSQTAQGDPQKTGPCGNEGGGTATGTVTAYRPGDMVTVTLRETVFHPGHYRIALSVNNRNELPAPPPATRVGNDACGMVPIQSPPVFPVLADGVLAHTSAMSGAQSISVRLPTDVTCTKCTLQVVEYMSMHAAPCFYYHCADISIQGAPADGGATGGASGTDAGSTDAGNRDGGGAATGGASGTGGSSGSGGSPGTGGSSTGSGGSGSGGSGGSPAGTGGSGSGGARGPDSGAVAGGDDSQQGCACALGHRQAGWSAVVAVLMVMVVGLRRRARPRQRRA
jgi:hypothetical protein